MSHGKKDWDGALQQCREIGSDLVSMQKSEEFTALKSILGEKEAFWIGGKFSTKKKWGGWHWSDGSSFNKWSKAASPKEETCLMTKEGKLQGEECSEKHRYVCKNPIYPA